MSSCTSILCCLYHRLGSLGARNVRLSEFWCIVESSESVRLQPPLRFHASAICALIDTTPQDHGVEGSCTVEDTVVVGQTMNNQRPPFLRTPGMDASQWSYASLTIATPIQIATPSSNAAACMLGHHPLLINSARPLH